MDLVRHTCAQSWELVQSLGRRPVFGTSVCPDGARECDRLKTSAYIRVERMSSQTSLSVLRICQAGLIGHRLLPFSVLARKSESGATSCLVLSGFGFFYPAAFEVLERNLLVSSGQKEHRCIGLCIQGVWQTKVSAYIRVGRMSSLTLFSRCPMLSGRSERASVITYFRACTQNPSPGLFPVRSAGFGFFYPAAFEVLERNLLVLTGPTEHYGAEGMDNAFHSSGITYAVIITFKSFNDWLFSIQAKTLRN